MEKEILKEKKEKMAKCLHGGTHEMALVRTGRASPSVFEHIKVDYYGTLTPLNQLSNITSPDPSLVVIQPWDKNSIQHIEKAILKTGLDLNPVLAGETIKVPFPPMSEERRKEMVKVAHNIAEECRVSMRNLRRDGRDEIKALEKDGKTSEDDSFRAQEELQKITDEYIHKIDKVLHEKEKEIMEG